MARTKRPGSQERIERRISAAGRLTLCVLLLLLQIFTTLALSAFSSSGPAMSTVRWS